MQSRAARVGVGLQACLVFVVVSLAVSALAQDETFKARLSPVPVDSTTVNTVVGSGSVTVVLNGNSLSIRGRFEGMQSPATIAQIRLGPRGIRGPVMFDLSVNKATSGSITGTLKLTPEQIEALRGGRFYVQVHSEKAPDGNLWGWLLR